MEHPTIGNGDCGSNGAALHFYRDQTLGQYLKRNINNFQVDHWEEGGLKEAYNRYPIEVIIGTGKSLSIQNENEMKSFLRNNKSSLMWSGAEDMKTISTLFQVPVKITNVSRRDSGQISWNHINFLPDPRLREFRLLAHAILTPFHIINYNQAHFSMVTKRDSPLATLGDVTTQLERETKEAEGKLKEEND